MGLAWVLLTLDVCWSSAELREILSRPEGVLWGPNIKRHLDLTWPKGKRGLRFASLHVALVLPCSAPGSTTPCCALVECFCVHAHVCMYARRITCHATFTIIIFSLLRVFCFYFLLRCRNTAVPGGFFRVHFFFRSLPFPSLFT